MKKPKWRLTHLPVLMAVKSAEVSDSALLQREALVLRNFHACPYIYRCFGEEVFTSDRNQMVYNLLLEYGSGGTLADVIKKTGGNGLPESDVRRYTRYILEGLDCVHSAGYVHRALKPDNIIIVPIITSTGTEYIAKIGDFGLAKKSEQARKILRMPISYKRRGSLQYSSPETVVDKGLQQQPPSDVWALGLIVFEMLTGKINDITILNSPEVSDSAMLQREAMVLSNFHACPCIYHCFGEEIMTSDCNRITYNILLEYGSGGTLADLIKKSGGRGLPESDVRCYTRHILEGLDCVHSFGYVHRALKPENIIIVSISTSIGTKYVAKVGDFGLAKTEWQMRKMMTMSKSYKLRGNIRCLSPEMVVDRGLQQETPSDVWDIGCIVFEMLTGKSHNMK
ncbi:hypothetical protein ACSBR1_043093 [Camellia fascicularis]